jgi:hypothetical protein
MATVQSTIPSRTLSPRQFTDLLEILRELDLELDFGRLPDGRMLKIAFPISCARAFLRAHEALERARSVSPMESPSTGAGSESLHSDLAFSTTTQLTDWIDAIEHYVDGYLERIWA